jgi:response regulator RpfG family c-di-GMP phosphodiesterase
MSENSKKRTILLLEDQSYILDTIAERFINHGYNVYKCKDIYKAIERFDSNQKEIDIIITDTNMDSNGLSNAEAKRSKNGKYSGWIWVTEYAIITKGFPPEQVYILSEYLKNLREYIELHGTDDEKKYYKIIKNSRHLFNKSNNEDPIKKMITSFDKIVTNN